MTHQAVLSGQSIAQELRKAWTSTQAMNEFLDNLTPQDHSRIPPSYTTESRRVEEECREIFRKLPRFAHNGLRIRKNDGYDHPWVERASGSPSQLLHVLGLNPTFSVSFVGNHMLHKDCPCMFLVVNCGFTERNCFGTDVFPVRIQNSHLRNVSADGDPFEAYPQFKELFLKDHLPSVLKYGAKVLLVLGTIAFEAVSKVLHLRKVTLNRTLRHLEIYCQMAFLEVFYANLFQEQPEGSRERCIRRLVIHVYHPRYFLPDDIYDSESDDEIESDMEDAMNEEMERKLHHARRMEESFNLVAHLTGINLPSQTYWTDYVLENYGEYSEMDEEGENL